MNKISSLFLAVLSILTINLNAQWNWVNPVPQGNSLNAIQYVDTICYAVGQDGKIIRTANSSDTLWVDISTDFPMDLFDVHFVNNSIGYAVGDNGIILKSGQNDSWDTLSSGTHYLFKCISFANEATGVAAGYQGLIKRTTNEGESWVEINSGTSKTLNSIFFSSDQTGFMVGDDGAVIKTTDAGASWSTVLAGTAEILYDVYFPTPQIGFIVGRNGKILKSTDGGNTWNDVSNTAIDETLYAVYFKDATNGFIAGANGLVLKTSNGGLSWVPQDTPLNLAIYDITANSNGESYFTGSMGTIMKSNDIGNEYTILVSGSNQSLSALHFVDKTTGYAVGGSPFDNKGLILKTEDEGDSWSQLISFEEHLYDVFFLDRDTGYVTGVGGIIYKTTDGGLDWDTLNSNTLANLYSIYFPFPRKGYAVGIGGRITYTSDYGQSWDLIPSGTTQHLFHISFTDDKDFGIITGNNGVILKIIDSTYITSLSSGTSIPLYDADFLDNSRGYISGYNGTILRTSNAGEDWIKKTSGVNSPLTSVFYYNDTTAYACGDGGTILKTNDGGNFWFHQNTGTSNNFGDIWFTSIDTGIVVGAGLSIMKTVIGGGYEPPQSIYQHFVPEINLSVYPNPVSSKVYVDYELEDNSKVSIGLFDLSGRLVSIPSNTYDTKGKHTFSTDLSEFPAGIYLVILRINDYYYSEKLIKID
jgi:photosystem II stability/assembly factor-like uncharacterized protein